MLRCVSYLLTYLLFLWLFPSCRVAGMTDDLSSPHRPVRLLPRSQSSTFQISLTRVFPSCFRSSSLPFPWYIRSQYFPQYVFTISPHHMPVPDQSSLGDLFGSLRHSCCSSDVFIPGLVFACHSAHPSSHPHLGHLNPFFLSLLHCVSTLHNVLKEVM